MKYFYHHFCIYDFGKRKKNLYEVVEEWVSDNQDLGTRCMTMEKRVESNDNDKKASKF